MGSRRELLIGVWMKTRIIRLFCWVMITLAMSGLYARTLHVGPLHVSAYVDTVVSTNVLFNGSRSDVRNLDVRLQLNGSVSNAVEIAFGHDGDQDGDLSVNETDVVLGWRGGFYSLEDVARDCRVLEPATNDMSAARFLNLSVVTDARQEPRAFDAFSDEGPRFSRYSEQVPAWAYGSDWNVFKVIRRGVVEPGETVTVGIGYERFVIRLR